MTFDFIDIGLILRFGIKVTLDKIDPDALADPAKKRTALSARLWSWFQDRTCRTSNSFCLAGPRADLQPRSASVPVGACRAASCPAVARVA